MWEIKNVDSYSELIEPRNYHNMMRNHMYIRETDEKIYNLIKEKVNNASKKLNICEIGAGTGALTELIVQIKNINLIIIEVDINFYKILVEKFKKYKNVTVVNINIIDYNFEENIDIFFSMGVHHHISKGQQTLDYLKYIKSNLREGGIYLLADEFIPTYNNEKERTLNLILWFSHIIESARLQGYDRLAIEEARTLYYDILGIEDYKTSLQELDIELSKTNLIRRKTIRFGPKDDIGGLYICMLF